MFNHQSFDSFFSFISSLSYFFFFCTISSVFLTIILFLFLSNTQPYMLLLRNFNALIQTGMASQVCTVWSLISIVKETAVLIF